MTSLRARALQLHETPRASGARVHEFLASVPRTRENSAALSIARARLSRVHRDDGEFSAAFTAALDARGRAEEARDLVALSLARVALGYVFFSVGQLHEAKNEFLAVAGHEGLPALHVMEARIAAAAVLRAQGLLSEASEAFDALMLQTDGLPPGLAAQSLINAASCWHQVGRVEAARKSLDLARSLMASGVRTDLWVWHDAILAWVEAASGDGDAAVLAARAALEPSRSPSLEARSSAVRALTRIALTSSGDLRSEILEQTQSVLESAEKLGARQQAVDLHLSVSQLSESGGDLVAAVEHLRRARALEELLAQDEKKLTQEKERLRLELARMQVEADTLRAGKEELARANRALAAADGARTRLLRTLAHDLRNPLMSVFGALDLLDRTNPDEFEVSLRQIDSAAERMKDILEGALHPSADPSGTRVDVSAVAQRCVAAFSGFAARKGQTLTVEGHGDTSLSTNSDSLGRVVDNLLSNALKYSGSGTEIRVVVRGRGNRVELLVLDQGPGLPELNVADGLMLGSRLATRATEGEASWGIGLHTVYALTAELGGVLALGNRPEGGAVIRVSLPRLGS